MKPARSLLRRSARLGAAVSFAALLYGPTQGLAAPILGSTLASYAVLGASDVTCVPTCVIGGNVGSDPTAPTSPAANFSFSFGSFQPGTQGTAQTELDAAILAVNAFGPGTTIGTGDNNLDTEQTSQGGAIAPGTYTVPAVTTNLLGTLILDGGGSNSAVWVFLFPSTLITSTTSNVLVTDIGDGADVGIYWSVGSSATINGPTFAGNVLASTSISSDGDLTIACGRLLAATGAVTLIHDDISIGCADTLTNTEASGGFDQGVDTGFALQSVPAPGALLLFGLGLAGLFAFRKRLLPVA